VGIVEQLGRLADSLVGNLLGGQLAELGLVVGK
jgi:hypothetical protein